MYTRKSGKHRGKVYDSIEISHFCQPSKKKLTTRQTRPQPLICSIVIGVGHERK